MIFYLTNYRPQRSCGKVIFSQESVSHSVHRMGVSASVHAGIHTPWEAHPPPEAHPPGSTPPGSTTPPQGSTHPRKHTSSREAHILPWEAHALPRSLQRTVRILLECFLVLLLFLLSEGFFFTK